MMGSNQLHGTTDSSATKNTKGHRKLVWFVTHSFEHIPKIRRKPVRCYVRQKHIIPTFTDGFTCVEKHKRYVFHGRKKRVSEHPLIESRGAVFRRSEDRLRFKSIICGIEQIGESIWTQRPYLMDSGDAGRDLPPGHSVENTLSTPAIDTLTIGSDGSVYL